MQTPDRAELLHRINKLTAGSFEATALAVFRYQAAENPLYGRFLQLLGRDPARVLRLSDIPCLPIQFFKTHRVQSGAWTPETEFNSSGTTGQTPSRHWVRHLDFYRENARRGFEGRYGPLRDWCVLALLPAYLERPGSSLVVMADDFMRRSGHADSGFFLHDLDRLAEVLRARRAAGGNTLLLGVSFALLDLAERYPQDLGDTVVMETGGMKGRRQEITREDLHARLQAAFQVENIHSEYGMTELFSQAYSPGSGLFEPAPTLSVFTSEVYDPLGACPPGRTGTLNAIDLANLDTCAFIATEDLGRVHPDGRFEVLGRLDAAELRGCNLMVE